MRYPRLTYFACGALFATVLAAVPATALVMTAADPSPNTYDGASPSLNVLPAQFVLGGSLNAAKDATVSYCEAANQVPLEMRWTGSDSTSGVAGYDVWSRSSVAGDGAGEQVHGTSATSYRFSGSNYNADCGGGDHSTGTYWVVARDNRGNAAMSGSGISQWVDVWQEDGTGHNTRSGPLVLSSRTGTWSKAACTCFNWGRTLYSTVAGASLTYTVTTQRPGQTIAVAVEKNSNRGVIDVSVDGATSTAVNTYAAAATHGVVVWQKTLTPGTHTLKLTNAGTAGRSRVDIDSVLLTLQPAGVTPRLATD
jgi:hypothetical protein